MPETPEERTTGVNWFQGPSFHAPLPQPCKVVLDIYAIRIIAVLEAAVGNCIVKVPLEELLFPPKSKAHTALLLEELL